MQQKTAFITGTTSGFGYAFSLRLASLGYKLVITGRREDRLYELAEKIRKEYQVEVLPLCFDVRDKNACAEAINQLPENFKKIDFSQYF